MPRYLSADWFAAVVAASAAVSGPADLVLDQVVTGGPDGEVRYRVEVRDGHASLHVGTTGSAEMTFTSDYATASAIERGDLSTQAALLEGAIRVTGDPVALAGRHGSLAGLDPVPPAVRAATTYR